MYPYPGAVADGAPGVVRVVVAWFVSAGWWLVGWFGLGWWRDGETFQVDYDVAGSGAGSYAAV